MERGDDLHRALLGMRWERRLERWSAIAIKWLFTLVAIVAIVAAAYLTLRFFR